MSQMTEGKRNSLRELPRNVWVVTVTSFLTDISSEMVINLLPLFLANVLGIHTGLIGLIEGLAESAASLLKIVSGWFSDRLGRRKQLAVAGYAISTVIKPFLYLATNWWVVLAVRFGDRIGKGVRTAPRDALVADSTSPRQRGLAYGLHRAGDTAGAMIGILVAMAIVWVAQAGAFTLTRVTFQRIVLVSVAPAAAAVLVLAMGARETAVARPKAGSRLSWQGLAPQFRRFLLVLVLFTLGNSADAFLILRAQERGLSVLGILGMLATFNLIYAVLAGPFGALADRFGRTRLITAGWLVYGMLYLGFALARSAAHIWILYALYGVYYAAVEGSAKAYVADIVPQAQRGAAFGWYHAATGVAMLPASLLAGILWQGVGAWQGLGPAAPFLWGAVLAVTAVILLQTWVLRLSVGI